MLKPEEINGKMYQPVEDTNEGCGSADGVECAVAGEGVCNSEICMSYMRKDNLDVYYINIEGE